MYGWVAFVVLCACIIACAVSIAVFLLRHPPIG